MKYSKPKNILNKKNTTNHSFLKQTNNTLKSKNKIILNHTNNTQIMSKSIVNFDNSSPAQEKKIAWSEREY